MNGLRKNVKCQNRLAQAPGINKKKPSPSYLLWQARSLQEKDNSKSIRGSLLLSEKKIRELS